LLAAKRYRSGMTVRGSMTITSLFRYVLAAKRYRSGMTVNYSAQDDASPCHLSSGHWNGFVASLAMMD